MKALSGAIAAIALSLAVSAQADDEGRYVLRGDLSAVYASGDMVIWTPRPKGEGGGGAMAMGMAMSSPARPGSNPDEALEKTLNVIAKAPLEDGKFVIEGTVDEPRLVYFYVLNATSVDGHRRAPLKGQSFILEPGELVMTMDDRSRFVITGGRYNDAVYNSWKLSPAYREASERMRQALNSPQGDTEEEQKARSELITRTQSELLTLETEGYRATATTHRDFTARVLAFQANWLRSGWELDALREMEKMQPDNAWVKQQIAQEMATNERIARQREAGRVGSDIRDFTAKTLDGREISLKDVRGRTRYVLVEFWASWCGPCRAEIPHMKKAYERYRDKGFEIFSFTIDDSRAAWEKASKQEQIPWIDTGFGSQSEPRKLYEVSGVPANYLVDSSTGKIVARDLRGQRLDEKLAELLDGQST